MRGRGKQLSALAVLALAFALCVGLAQAELVERGNLFVKFQGGIAPTRLPRQANAPISVEVDGTVRTLSGEQPPALRFITIAINRGGRVETKGLPICRRSSIDAANSAQALAACRGALVGRGRYVAGVAFPEQDAFPLQGSVLAFNTVDDGKRAILAHVYGAKPFPNSRTFVFHIRRSQGTYGTVLSAALPAALNSNGYLKRIVHLPRSHPQLPERRLRGAARLHRRRLPLRPRRDDLLRRPQARLHLDPHLHRPQIGLRR